MMAWLYTFAFLGTTAGLWRRVAVLGEKKGRGWLFRNWTGAVIGGFVGMIVVLIATSDSTVVSLIGFVLAISATAAPWWPEPEQEAKTTEQQKPTIKEAGDITSEEA